MTTLATSGLSLSLGGVPILRGVDAQFAAGQVAALIGPNGAGKSSLMACLAGLRMPGAGSVTLDGVDRGAIDRRALARRIGYLPQTPEVHWDVDVATLVALGRFAHQDRWAGASAQDRAAVADAMAITDVTALAARRIGTLSGGERARVLLARVLAGAPEWLLADEPLANLDPAHQLDALACLRRVAEAGAGVVVVLHDLNHAARVADAVMVMQAGTIIASGPPDTVLTADVIARTYGVEAEVGTAVDGSRIIVALARHRERASDA